MQHLNSTRQGTKWSRGKNNNQKWWLCRVALTIAITASRCGWKYTCSFFSETESSRVGEGQHAQYQTACKATCVGVPKFCLKPNYERLQNEITLHIVSHFNRQLHCAFKIFFFWPVLIICNFCFLHHVGGKLGDFAAVKAAVWPGHQWEHAGGVRNESSLRTASKQTPCTSNKGRENSLVQLQCLWCTSCSCLTWRKQW